MHFDLSNAQNKQFIDAVHVFEGVRQARAQALDYRGGMHWKTIKGKEYLYRSLDRHGHAKSLGPRDEKTERILAEFVRRKFDLTQRIKDLSELNEQNARVNKALRLGSVPNEVADVCERLDEAGLMGKSMMVIGTNAMHAYESLAAVRFPSDIMATVDIDLLWNHKTKLSLAATQALDQAGLIGLLKKADKSYEQDTQNPFRARSKSGFMVDLIRQMPDPPWADEPDRFFDNDLVATDIKNMQWMLNAPRIEQPAVAQDGRIVMISAPDPRAFAIFKIWLSSAEDREPAKRQRDLAQARAVVQVIEEKLPHLNNWGVLNSFPESVMQSTANKFDRIQWPGRERGG